MIGIGDPVASVGRLTFSITDRRNSSLRSSDTTGRAFRKSKTTLARAPMVSNPDHLRLALSLNYRLVLIWEISISLEISRMFRLPIVVDFRLYFLCRLSSAVRWRVLCLKTIGAGTSVRLGFPNARPVVFDERSEEFRRSVSSSNKREKNKIFCFSEQEKNRWNQRKPYRTVPGEPAWRYKIRNRNRKKKN